MISNLTFKNKSGFTLVELILAIAILGILTAIGIPRMFDLAEKTQRATCLANRAQLERFYNVYLDSEELEHKASLFDRITIEYFDGKDICPKKGIISFVEGNLTCSIHMEEDQTDQDDQDNGEEVPYL
jgi:prepilin-type N-terminal cleavage/methylation domain-containing protein